MHSSLLEVQILGDVRVREGDRTTSVPGAAERTLLCLLALRRDQPWTGDQLAEALWGHDAASRSRTTLSVHLSNLRSVLGDRSVIPRGRYLLVPERVTTDHAQFEEGVTQGLSALSRRETDHGAALLRAALARCRGDVGVDTIECEPIIVARAAHSERRLVACEALYEAEISGGRAAHVVTELEQAVREHPFREGFWALLMRAHFGSGRQADALRTYQRARSVLINELGLDPGPALRHLEQAILEQRVNVPTPPPVSSQLVWLDADGRQRDLALTGREDPVSIGRAGDNDIVLDWDRQVSRHHARLEPAPSARWRLVDLGAANGSRVNGAAVDDHDLVDGDVIRLGQVVLLARLAGAHRPRLRNLHDDETLPAP